jgi:UTP--glucose-1-phosphate uridylyltransferase
MAVRLAVVPVAGLGTRLLPLTKSQPKEMLPVGRKPVVQHVVEELANSGVDRFLFITGQGKQSIEDFFDLNTELIRYLRETGREDQLCELEFEQRPIEFAFIRQREQLGLGHAILCAEPFVANQPFVVALGDSIIGLNAESRIVERMVSEFEQRGADAVIAFEELADRNEVVHYGIGKPRGTAGDVFELDDIVEKPAVEEAPSSFAVAARYIFSPKIFEYLASQDPGKGNEIQLTDAIRRMLKDGRSGIGVGLDKGESRYDIGNFNSYFRAFTEFAMADPVYGQALKQHLQSLK